MRVAAGFIELRGEDDTVLDSVETTGGYLMSLGPDLVLVDVGPPFVVRLRRQRPTLSDEEGVLGDVPVGKVPVVIERSDRRGVEVGWLTIPPPAGFRDEDIHSMWTALSAVPASARAAVRRTGLSEAGRRFHASDVDVYLPSFRDLHSQTRHVLNHWPQRESSMSMWRPLDLPGGTEDVRGTLKALPRLPVIEVDGQALPARTLRRLGDNVPWQLHGAAQLAQRVIDRIAGHPDLVDGDNREELLGPLREFRWRAQPAGTARDVPPSSWPAQLRIWFDTASEVLAQVEAHGEGERAAPLCHLHELFEAWIAVAVHEDLESALGPPAIRMRERRELGIYGKPAWFSRWAAGAGVTVDLWAQLALGEDVVQLAGSVPMRSFTSILVPDVLVVASDGVSACAVAVDAKFTSRRQVPSGTVTQTGSKYLWGLRREDDREHPVLSKVTVVSNADPSPPFDVGLSRIESVVARPETGSQELWEAIAGSFGRDFPLLLP